MKIKKILSIFLAVVMAFSTSIVAFAADSETLVESVFTEGIFTYRLLIEGVEIMKCDTSAEGKVVIPAKTQNGHEVAVFAVKAFENCAGITEIEIGENVNYMRYNPFYGCSSLVRFSVNEKNTFYTTDEYGVLYSKDMTLMVAYPGASAMENYVIPDGVVKIDTVFDSCSNLKTLTIPESVGERSNCSFENCPALTDIYFGGLENRWVRMDGGFWKTEENNITVHYREKNLKERIEQFFNDIGLASVISAYWGFYFVLLIPALPVLLVSELWNLIKSIF